MTTSTAITPVKAIGNALREMNLSLPRGMASEKFIQTIQTSLMNNPDLVTADRASLYAACSKAAMDGLILDGREAALVIFKGKVQYMPMVAGIIKKMRNTGEVATVSAHVIYAKDHFKHIRGLKEDIEHIAPDINEDRGEMVGVYAVGHLKDGTYQISVMNKKQVMAVKACAKTKVIWEGPFEDQQWEKSALKRLGKRMPSSSEQENIFQRDNEFYDLPSDEPRRVEGEVVQGTDDTKAARVIKGEEEPSEEPEVVEPEPDVI